MRPTYRNASCGYCGALLDIPEEIDPDTGEVVGPDFCSQECLDDYEDEWQAASARESLTLDIVQRYGSHMIGRLL